MSVLEVGGFFVAPAGGWASLPSGLYRVTQLHAERWRHIHGCARFFNCVRDTVSDKIVATYKAGEPRPEVGN